MHTPRRFAVPALAAGAVLSLSGCEAGVDDASIAYATDLTSHHAQTLQVLDLSIGRDAFDPGLGALADRIRRATFDEVDTSQRWLKRWDVAVPKTALQHTHDDAVSYDASVPGMLTAEQMHALETSDSADFQRAWLEQLAAHEEGAVELAEAAVEASESAEVTAFAEKDLADHRERLAELRQHLVAESS